MTPEYSRGCWDTLTYIVNYLNTLDTNMVSKKTLYKYLMGLHPEDINKMNEDF